MQAKRATLLSRATSLMTTGWTAVASETTPRASELEARPKHASLAGRIAAVRCLHIVPHRRRDPRIQRFAERRLEGRRLACKNLGAHVDPASLASVGFGVGSTACRARSISRRESFDCEVSQNTRSKLIVMSRKIHMAKADMSPVIATMLLLAMMMMMPTVGIAERLSIMAVAPVPPWSR